MSALAGVLRLDEARAAEGGVQAMLAAMRHCGPDAAGSWAEGPVALGHAPFGWAARGTNLLPLRDAEGGLAITADARLDNADVLADALGLELERGLGSVPDSAAKPERSGEGPGDPLALRDARLILAAYRKWGDECVEHLLGDFALALWDARAQRLLLARDAFGVRPLVYHHGTGYFAFASEIGGLLALAGVTRRLNRGRVADYLAPWLEGLDFESTFFEGIHRLPAGSLLVVEPGGTGGGPQRWFRLDPAAPTWRLGDDDAYQEAFLEQLRAAVDRRLCRASPVASMLSGGLDSSSLCALATERIQSDGGPALRAFSAVSDADPAGPETEAIGAVVDQLGLEPRQIRSGDLDALGVESVETIGAADDLFDFEITINPALFALAGRDGVATLMTGVDGDICAGVSARYLICLLRAGRPLATLREALGLARNRDSGWRYAAHLLAFCLRSAVFPGATRRRHRAGKIAEQLGMSMIDPGFAHAIDLPGRLGQIYDLELPCPEPADLAHRHALLIGAPSLAVALERYDRRARRYGIELAHPFFDRRLVEFGLRLPVDQRARHGWWKWILRQAIGDRLPRAARWRRENDNVNDRFAFASTLRLQAERRGDAEGRRSRLRPFVATEWLDRLDRGIDAAIGEGAPDWWKHRRLLLLDTWLEHQFPNG